MPTTIEKVSVETNTDRKKTSNRKVLLLRPISVNIAHVQNKHLSEFSLLPFYTFGFKYYRPQRSCGKVMFSQACVKNSVHRGEGVCPSACWDTLPGQTPPGGHCSERYASYWNAFLLLRLITLGPTRNEFGYNDHSAITRIICLHQNH